MESLWGNRNIHTCMYESNAIQHEVNFKWNDHREMCSYQLFRSKLDNRIEINFAFMKLPFAVSVCTYIGRNCT